MTNFVGQLDYIGSVCPGQSFCDQTPPITKHEKLLINWLIDEETCMPDCRPPAVRNHRFQWLI